MPKTNVLNFASQFIIYLTITIMVFKLKDFFFTYAIIFFVKYIDKDY
jgi:hypothetical protein